MMVSIHLFDNYFGPVTASVNGPTTTFEIGTDFHVTVASDLKQLRWYRWSTGTPAPSNLRVWDSTTGGVVATAASVPDNGQIGWQTHTFAVSPVTLVANRTYYVSMSTPNNFPISNGNTSVFFAPSEPLVFESNARSYRLNSFLIPNTFDNAVYHLVDVGIEVAAEEAPPTQAVTNESLDARLDAWLDKDSTDQPDSTPILTWQAVTDADTGLPKILTNVGNIATNMLTAESAILGTITDGLDDIDAALVNALGPAGNLVTGSLRTYLNGLETSINNTLGLIEQVRGGVQGMAPGDDPGWTVVAGDSFTGPFRVPDKCDRILVAISDLGDANRLATYVDISFLSFAWWWAPMFGDYVGSHRTSRALNADLHVPGRQLDGALVVVPADFTGTWQALRFDG